MHFSLWFKKGSSLSLLFSLNPPTGITVFLDPFPRRAPLPSSPHTYCIWFTSIGAGSMCRDHTSLPKVDEALGNHVSIYSAPFVFKYVLCASHNCINLNGTGWLKSHPIKSKNTIDFLCCGVITVVRIVILHVALQTTHIPTRTNEPTAGTLTSGWFFSLPPFAWFFTEYSV